MENSEIRKTLRQLEAVWQRVGQAPETSPPARVPQPDEAEALGAAIYAAEAGAQYYRALSRLTRFRAAGTLLCMAAGLSRDARALQERYFLRTGDSLRVVRETPELPGLLRALRTAWTQEAEYRRLLSDPAVQSGETEDRERLSEMLRRSAERQSALRCLLRQCMQER